MISQFPQIRPEESTYSIFARLQSSLQLPDYRTIGKILFNNTLEVGSLNFQGFFDYLCSNLPTSFTPENFLKQNTIFPLFSPFLSLKDQEYFLACFKHGYLGRNIKKLFKVSYVTNHRKYIRICKECIKEDFINYGEPYYRRQHEIDLNRMCHKHKIPLYEYTISRYSLAMRYEDYFTVLSKSKELSIPKEFENNFLNIADDINNIFTSPLDNLNLTVAEDKISNKLYEAEYENEIKVFVTKLSQDFKNYYTEDFLNYIEYNFSINNTPNCWLINYAKAKYHYTNPLKFLLLIRFLFGSFKNYYDYPYKRL